MHKKIGIWLQSYAKQDRTVLSYLTELIAINRGSYELKSVGAVQKNDTVWGRVGLTPQEAIDFVKLTSFLNGMVSVLDEDAHEIGELIQREIEKKERGSSLIVPTSTEIKMFGEPK